MSRIIISHGHPAYAGQADEGVRGKAVIICGSVGGTITGTVKLKSGKGGGREIVTLDAVGATIST